MAGARGGEIIIIGGGIIGACVAHALTEAGSTVTLLVDGMPGRGTSAASLAWVNAVNKTPEAYNRLNAAGMQSYAELRDRFGPECGIHLDGALNWVESDEQRAELRERYERLRGWDYPVEWVTPEQVMSDLAPELGLEPHKVQRLLHMPAEGWIDAPLFIHVLLERFRQRGGELRCGARVRTVRREAGRATGVVTEAGESFDADWVINCAGPDADRVAAAAGVRLPMARVPGLLLVTDRVPVRLRQVVHPPGPSFRPDGGGRAVILTGWAPPGSPDEVLPAPSLPPPADAEDLLAGVARWLPALRTARVEAARLGVRPMPLDGYPIVGPHPDMPGFYVVVTHSGITLGPVLGPLVAAEVTTGRPEPLLAPYRPDRFLEPRLPPD
jgi:glycine/D-amino acid oxidase-like deaminating enzyme